MIDILTQVLGVGDYERLKARAQSVSIGGRAVRMIALDDLIAAKEALSRDKDIATAKELRLIALRRDEKSRPGQGPA